MKENATMNILPASPGIYQIVCTETNKRYIGSAKNLRQRWNDHRKLLRYDKHKNDYLQKAWNKYGENNFRFLIIEFVSEVNALLQREQMWLDVSQSYDEKLGFNIATKAGSNIGRKFPKEFGDLISSKKKMDWPGFINPEGQEVVISNLWKFCHENNLHFGAMWNLANGKGRIKSYKGWRFKGNDYTRILKEYDGFIDPSGGFVEPITKLNEFCKKNNLSTTKMILLHQGKRKSHKGWRHTTTIKR
jgi:group I intron endonuclease